jgi:hypothetical protein
MAISFPQGEANGRPFYVLMAECPTIFEKPAGIEMLLKTPESPCL